MITALLVRMKMEAATKRVKNNQQYHTVFHIIDDIVVSVQVGHGYTKVFMTDGHDSYFSRNIGQASRVLKYALAA